MTRRTMPPPSKRDEVTLDRRYTTAFAALLTALGMGDVRVGVDDRLEGLLERATERAMLLAEELRVERLRANRLQQAAPALATAADYRHHVQWRAVDADEGVVIRGEWTPSADEQQAKRFLAAEMVAADRDDLTPQRLVRCNHFEITSIATPDSES